MYLFLPPHYHLDIGHNRERTKDVNDAMERGDEGHSHPTCLSSGTGPSQGRLELVCVSTGLSVFAAHVLPACRLRSPLKLPRLADIHAN